jgi:DsbC/DsbD-like thiol-disulfide interchange protein
VENLEPVVVEAKVNNEQEKSKNSLTSVDANIAEIAPVQNNIDKSVKEKIIDVADTEKIKEKVTEHIFQMSESADTGLVASASRAFAMAAQKAAPATREQTVALQEQKKIISDFMMKFMTADFAKNLAKDISIA